MTTIAFYQQDGDVELAFDSKMTTGNEQGVLKTPKVFARGNVVFGVAGNALAINVLLTHPEVPEYDGTDELTWVMQTLRPWLLDVAHSDPGLWEDEHDHPTFSVLVVVNAQAFEFDGVFSPDQTEEGLYAIGSGADYIKGALWCGADIEDALRAATELDPYSGGPLHITTASELIAKGQNSKIFENQLLDFPEPEHPGVAEVVEFHKVLGRVS